MVGDRVTGSRSTSARRATPVRRTGNARELPVDRSLRRVWGKTASGGGGLTTRRHQRRLAHPTFQHSSDAFRVTPRLAAEYSLRTLVRIMRSTTTYPFVFTLFLNGEWPSMGREEPSTPPGKRPDTMERARIGAARPGGHTGSVGPLESVDRERTRSDPTLEAPAQRWLWPIQGIRVASITGTRRDAGESRVDPPIRRASAPY